MKKICVVTATRAEYSLLKPIIIALKQSTLFNPQLVVTGSHLSPEFGMTLHVIQKDEIPISKKN